MSCHNFCMFHLKKAPMWHLTKTRYMLCILLFSFILSLLMERLCPVTISRNIHVTMLLLSVRSSSKFPYNVMLAFIYISSF